jgi:hypothetical protein
VALEAEIPLEVAYWEHYRLSVSTDRGDRLQGDQWSWAWDRVNDLVSQSPEEAVSVLVALADAAPDHMAISYLGAGPVEDLIVGNASPIVIDRIEGAARRHDRFRIAVRQAWFDDRVSESVRARLRAFGTPD